MPVTAAPLPLLADAAPPSAGGAAPRCRRLNRHRRRRSRATAPPPADRGQPMRWRPFVEGGDDDRVASGPGAAGVRPSLIRVRSRSGVDDVAVCTMLLALEPHLAVLLAGVHRTARHQVIVADDLSADEAALDIAVISPAASWAGVPRQDRPGSRSSSPRSGTRCSRADQSSLMTRFSPDSARPRSANGGVSGFELPDLSARSSRTRRPPRSQREKWRGVP